MLDLKFYIYNGLLVTCAPVIEIPAWSGQFWANYSCLFALVIQLWPRSLGRGAILGQSVLWRDWWCGWNTKSQTVFNSSAARIWSCASVVAPLPWHPRAITVQWWWQLLESSKNTRKKGKNVKLFHLGWSASIWGAGSWCISDKHHWLVL
jgi:hypothetical protein